MNRLTMLKMTNAVLAAGCITVAAALWLRPAPPPEVLVTAAAAVPAGHDIPTPGTNAAEEALRTLLPAIHDTATTFAAAIKRLSDSAHFNLQLRWEELKKTGVSPDVQVELTVPAESTLRDALRKLIETVNRKRQLDVRNPDGSLRYATIEPPMIGFQVEDGQIVISSLEDLSQYKTTIVYNVRDIIDASVDASGPRLRTAPPSRLQAADRLMKLIMDEAGPFGLFDRTPEDNGVHEVMGLLIVTLSPRQQEKVAALLQALREGSRELPPASRAVFE